MHWKFDNLFTISIGHDLLPTTPETGMPQWFSVVPSVATSALLRQYNWLYRPVVNGAMIVAEKTILADGTEKILRKPEVTEVFTFIIYLHNSGLLATTKPYMVPEPSNVPGPVSPNTKLVPVQFPPFTGRSRLFCFDNLGSNNQPDETTLSEGAIAGLQDLASVVPTRAVIKAPSSSVQSIKFEGIQPANTPGKTFLFTPTQRTVQLELPPGVYRCTPDSGAPAEIIVVDDEFAEKVPFGIVRIFKDQALNYASPKNYTLKFAKA